MSAAAVAYDPDSDEDEATRIAPALSTGGGLASAFNALVGEDQAEPSSAGMPADEWFVGINGSPVGPIRLAELRAKAASGVIGLDSLVWRDGYEEWRALKTFPELVAVIEEGLSSARASQQPEAPRPTASPPAPAVAARPSAVAPVADQAAPAAPLVVADPFAGAAPPPRAEPFANSAASSSPTVTGSALVTDELVVAGVSQPRTPLAVWAAIVVAMMLGLVIGFVVFSKQQQPEKVVHYVEVPAKAAAAPAAPTGEAAPAPVPTASVQETKKVPGGGSRGGAAAAPVAVKPEEKGTGLSGLKGLSGLGPSGPSGVTGGSAATPGGGSSQLDTAQIQSTVSRYTGSVKRSCWQPALDARDPSAPTTARVVVSITVGHSGGVQNVTTSGDPRGYPGLANCIAARVRGWQFPPSNGTTTANVPFVFAGQ